MSRLSRATRTAPSCVPPPPPPLRGHQPHHQPLLLHAAAAAAAQYIPPPPQYSCLQPFTTTRPTCVPPAFRAPPPHTHAPLRSNGLLPPTSVPHAWTPPTACPHHIPTYRDVPQPTPSSPMHPILHGPQPPIKRLAAPPRVSLPTMHIRAPLCVSSRHYASRPTTTCLVPPLRVSSHHYASHPATTRLVQPLRMLAPHHPCRHPHHPCGLPTMRLAALPAPTMHPVLLHTILWPLSCVPALRFRWIQSHLRGVCRH